MATNYNITMKRYNGTDYDVLYPRTLPSQIDGGVYTKDEATGLFLSKTGGQMSGLLDMNGNKISNLAAPTAANDAATKDYVDAIIPAYTTADDGKVLGVVEGKLAWVAKA